MDDAVENEDPPPEEEDEDEDDEESDLEEDEDAERQRNLDAMLEGLERNQPTECALHTHLMMQGKLSVAQAKSLYSALKKNTSVEKFSALINYCELPALGLFVDYIQTSPTLKNLYTGYSTLNEDSEDIRKGYKTQLDRIFRAARERENSIQKLSVFSFGNPESIYDLLVNSKSLTDFSIREKTSRISAQLAFSIAAGISKSSIKTLDFGLICGPCSIILSGIGASSVKSLTLRRMGAPHADFWESVSKLFLCAPSVKELEIAHISGDNEEARGCNIFLDLLHPACGLEKLVIGRVTLPDHAELGLSSLAPTERANTSLRVLTLTDVLFESPRAVRLLYNVVGLKELTILSPRNAGLVLDEVPHLEQYWGEFIVRNRDLVQLKIRTGSNLFCLNGVIEGTRQHQSLSKLWLMGMSVRLLDLDGDAGVLLSQCLQETTSLKELYFENVRLTPAGGTLLAGGLGNNRSVEVVHFKSCRMQAGSVTEILESLVANETLKDVAFSGLRYLPYIQGSIGQTLSRVFQENTSLVKLMVSFIDLGAGRMAESLLGLKRNDSLKTLMFDHCPLDNDALNVLGQALESPDVLLEEIGFGPLEPSDNVKQGVTAFLRSLPSMHNVHTVHFGNTTQALDAELLELMLRAVKENKNLCTMSRLGSPFDDQNRAELTRIHYYLKVNRFGRRLLDSPNVPLGLWPRLLSRMSGQPNDADALFYFVREYYSRQGTTSSDNKEDHQESTENQEKQQPPCKRARVE